MIGQGERWLRGGYAFVFAAVLPLLCWGSIADPHHPHWHAHFVFFEPETVETTAAERFAGAPHEHDPCLHPPGAHPSAPTLADTTPPSQSPTGQAVPATVLAQVVLLTMWAATTLFAPASIPFATYLDNSVLKGAMPRVPTPPPRLLSA